MTNPNNAVGTNAAFGGRTSVNAFNDDLAAFSRGILSGWECVPDSGMTVAIGGSATVRDVAVAEDDAGNKTTINNISLAPISITIGGAPASNTRIDSIVAYVDNPPQGTSTITDNYESCGIIVVPGTASASPVAPNESTIRTAITSDGASGSTAYYVVLADVTVASGTTDISSSEISQTQRAGIGSSNIDFTTLSTGTPTLLGWNSAAGGTHTATTAEIIHIQTAVAGGANVKVYKNNELLATSQSSASSFEWIPITVFACNGDEIKAVSSDSGGNAQVVASGCKYIAIS